MPKVFENQTANGDSLIWPGQLPPTININEGHTGGDLQLSIVGTFDGATIAIQVDQDGLGFNPLIGSNQVAPDVNELSLGRGARLKLVLSGVGASTDISASIINV